MDTQEVKKIYKFIDLSQNMKIETRVTILKNGRNESIADHTYFATMLANLLIDSLKEKLDKDKVINMVLIHDLPEAITGDYHSYKVHTGELSREEKKEREKEAIKKYLSVLPKKQGLELLEIWRDYEKQNNREAKFAKAIDRLETMLQWANMDFKFYHDGHDYMGTYGNKEIMEFPELLPLWHEMKVRLKKRFEAKGAKWKPEYEI